MRSVARVGMVLSLFVFSVFCAELGAQTGTGALQGQVKDPSGAVVTQATVLVTGANGQTAKAATNNKGMYEINGLTPGKYAVRVTAKGFANFETQDLAISAGAPQVLDIPLQIAVEETRVNVEDENATVSTDSASNASTVVIKGKDLDALSDDPDELQSDLEALAGPSAGPNGGQIYIDGFSDGALPPKSAIREIRVNQNPFSAQYDRLGFGRVEVFTKPGQDTYHGQMQMNVNHSLFNSRNPFLTSDTVVPDYHSQMYMGNFGGPINKKASFFLNFERRDISDPSIVNATLPCSAMMTGGTCTPDSLGRYDWQNETAALPGSRMHMEMSPRFDYQVNQNNTLTARYEYESSNTDSGGVGQYSLPTKAYNSNGYEHNFRVTDTQVLSSTMINETRIQFVREHTEQNPLFMTPTIRVQDTFTSGGNSTGIYSDDQNRVEFQNYTSKVYGKHFTRFGGRLRVVSQDDYSLNNPYGSFVYQSKSAYELQQPLKFTISTGNPRVGVTQADAGLYAEDDWKVKSNITVSYGLRFETQNNVSNRANFAPRLGFAWGLGKGPAPKTVLRAGFGMFYDRFGRNNVMDIVATNHADPTMNQHNYQVDWQGLESDPPVFNTVPTNLSTLSASQIIYDTDERFKLPYTMQVAATLERQISKTATMTATYIGTRGLHQLVMDDLQSGTTTNPIDTFLYRTAGTFKQNQFMVNGTLRAGHFVSLFGWYMLGYANGNTSGGFPSAPFDLAADWGRSSFDVRHRGMIGGSINLPYGFRLNPFIIMSSARPYNIVTGNDPIYNKRPYFSDGCAGIPLGQSQGQGSNAIYNTTLGCFSAAPTSLGLVPVNYAEATGIFVTNLRVSKTFGLGRKLGEGERGPGSGGGPGGGHQHGPSLPGAGNIRSIMQGGGTGRRYNLTLSASARNLFNTVNEATPSGNLNSGDFARAVAISNFGMYSSSANRRVDFQVSFNF